MDETVSYHFATVKQRRENRHEIDYQLTLRQQPKQSRMCGVGEKADRRPIDPPPIVQLKVVDSQLSVAEKNTYLQNPYYFMYASLMAADLDEELHLLRDGKTRSTTGSVVSSLYHLKDIDNTDAGFFVFPDLSVRMEGSYRLKLSLFEIIGKEVFHCRSIISNKFFVYSAKKFPGMEESTFLSRSFADQGLKIRIRKELRQRRKLSKMSDTEDKDSNNNNGTLSSPSASTPSSSSQSKSGKRLRKDQYSITSPSVIPHPQHRIHSRNDLPPNPTRFISYSSKQEVWAPPSISDPHNRSENTRYYEGPQNSMNPNTSSITKSATLAVAAATMAAATMSMSMERPPKQQYYLHSDTPDTSPSIYHHPQNMSSKFPRPHEQQLQQHIHHHHHHQLPEIPMPHANMMTSYSSTTTSAYSRPTTNDLSSYSYYSREQASVSLPPPPNNILPHPLPSSSSSSSPPSSHPPSSLQQQQQHQQPKR